MLAEQIVIRFRVVSLERLARLEAGWTKAVADPTDAEAIAAMHREVHTLKGDARMVGFTDVDLVCHKLEDMLQLAAERDHQVSDDFELIVIMAVQLVGMLIRKRAGASFGGIDLPGFIRQMDAILAETRREQVQRPRVTTATVPRLETDKAKDQLSPTTRANLAHTALDLFLESSTVQHSRNKRVQRGWQALRDLLALPNQLPIAAILAKHEAGALELARELGKEVEVHYDASDIKADPNICDALEVATLHLVRNAIDHGVESAVVRAQRGKLPTAVIAIRCTVDDEQLTLEIADDGNGIDWSEVRRKAISRGLVAESAQPTEAELAEVLFTQGFSTRLVATEVSGRGIGLDAVGAAVSALGGKVTVTSKLARGAKFTVRIPMITRKVNAFGFAAPGSSVRLAIASDWSFEIVPPVDNALDLVEIFGIAAGHTPPGQSVTLRVKRGDMAIHFVAAWAPVEVLVRRMLVTPPDANAEVVSIDGFEGLLVRPDRLIQGTGRLAILDDSEICREMVKASLGPFGIEVLGLEEPSALIGTLAVTNVDMLLVDLSFEQLDLTDLIRRVRVAIPELPVYLHSDRPIPELQRIAEQTRADGYFSKTADADQMASRVSRVLRARRAAR